VQQRRSHRKLFVQAWPDLEAWLHAPLADRIGRIDGQIRSTLRNQPSYWARAYLYYLALTGRLRLDYTWLLAVGDLCVHDVVRHLGIDLGVETLAREGAQLGLIHGGADRAMAAVRALPDPFQRAAMIVARWSGARRSEVRRLTTDCLDSYPDGTARLRIPVGKTARERMIPLHDEAADALRAVLAIRADGIDRRLPDERTGELVRFVFVWRGKLMSDRHLFAAPLRRVCEAACLVDSAGKPTITMHRFRHTLGTELAERGAKLHTIMTILGHESPQMTMVYARISDAEVLRDYRSVLEPGAAIAGAGAKAIRAGALSAGAIDWLRSNFLKTELELGHCLRLPSEGPCECDLYLSCARFVTTPAYGPRLRERHRLELSLADDARNRGWPKIRDLARQTRCRLSARAAPAGDELDPARRSSRRAGPAQLDHPVSDLDFIPAQPPRDLVHRNATNEHLAQRVHLRIRPLSAGIHGQRFVICLGPPRIED
jgi:integrase